MLTNLYASTNGASWTNATNWNGGVGTECTWFGVTCDGAQNNVVTITLFSNNLVGTLPALSGLPALQYFNVFGNQLTGSIPSLSGLTALQYFDVSTNQLTGSIPSLSGLTALQYFSVFGNQLTGPIPSLSGLTALQTFAVMNNQLTGSIPSLTGLTALQYFSVFGNPLTGSIPSLSGLTALQFFDVFNNQLTGPIPSLTGLTALREFAVDGNQLTGPIPSLSGLTALEFFNVSVNQLTGSIPSLSGLTALRAFAVDSNQLTGPIPSLSGLTALQNFEAISNQLTGSIPSLSGLTALQQFRVNNNQLIGPVPAPPASLTPGGSTLCSNSLTTSGSAAIDVAWDTATGVNWQACQIVPPPTCTLNATPSAFFAGTATNVSLAAACANSPTSYSWSSSAGAPAVVGSGSTVTASFPAISSAGTYTYSVAATNASGTSPPATASVTVTAALPSPPVCTLIASPASIIAGASSSLTASCTPAATSYAWSANAGFGAAVASGTVSPTVITTYSVVGSNAGGTGNTASVTVTVTSGATPVCSLIAAPASIIAGASSFLTVTCNPAASSYAWAGGTCAGATTPFCTVSPQVTTAYRVAGLNSAGTGASAGAVVAVTRSVFPMTVTTSITPAVASAAAQIQPRPQDVGTTASVFVFAHVPASVLARAAAKYGLPAAAPPIEPLDGADPCVLAQINANGQLTGVTASTMQAYTTTVLTSQGQAVTILNSVSTPSVAGTSFLVGYGTNASTMFANGAYEGVISVTGPSQCTATLLAGAAPDSPGALSGIWWNANESGWGINFTQRRNIVFAAWYTYDSSGNPKWYVADSCALPSGVTGTSGTCNGSLYEVSGPTFLGTPFIPEAVQVVTAGTIHLVFQNADNASLGYTVSGQSRTVPIVRQAFQTGTMAPAVDYTDLWWNPSESGWGMAVTHQFGVMFLAWYVYDNAGKPMWYVASRCTVSGSGCSGTLYRTTGPVFGPAFDSSRIQVFSVGTVDLRFTDANNGVLSYTVNGVTASKTITRQTF